MWNQLAGSLVAGLAKALIQMTPQVKEAMKGMLDSLEQKANETSNPYDNVAVALLKGLIG
jgi:hypothetical protein